MSQRNPTEQTPAEFRIKWILANQYELRDIVKDEHYTPIQCEQCGGECQAQYDFSSK